MVGFFTDLVELAGIPTIDHDSNHRGHDVGVVVATQDQALECDALGTRIDVTGEIDREELSVPGPQVAVNVHGWFARHPVPADDLATCVETPNEVDVLALHESLERLAAFDPRQERIVELRYFGGLTIEEAAEVVGISEATVVREWTIAKAWLRANSSGRSG